MNITPSLFYPLGMNPVTRRTGDSVGCRDGLEGFERRRQSLEPCWKSKHFSSLQAGHCKTALLRSPSSSQKLRLGDLSTMDLYQLGKKHNKL